MRNPRKANKTDAIKQLQSRSTIPFSSYKPKMIKTFISSNSENEGRTGVIQITYFFIRYL